MFNLNVGMIERQCGMKGLPCNPPIRTDETLAPCIRGAEKILRDDTTKQTVRNMLLQKSRK